LDVLRWRERIASGESSGGLHTDVSERDLDARREEIVMKSRIVALCVLAVAFVSACADDPSSRVSTKLRRSLGVDARGVEVSVEGSRATLTGRVSERATQELAEEVALSVPGIASVENRIAGPEVGVVEKLRVETVDAALEVAVKIALGRGAGSDLAAALEVEACDGVVALRGTVASRDAAKRAVEVAGAVEGVRRVLDLVDVAGRP